ncbi:ABC transporter substrate-binding protein [Paracoccus saliphilus]|uniref:ABC transporter substrate-binding protein n=1 Tax=Paracoccus saliphilus TaxID=405559 RepID=A0AA46A774_9RHOB|nr:ABC transporter substrate-binding protein [Paracoccus saliphilus]WCR02727.1 ABC transporter substrate-binding protein [Paracoccus saliphilus]SIT09174.1 iron complex transport system substrate-binding protein [Paracoccus saliphilus]
MSTTTGGATRLCSLLAGFLVLPIVPASAQATGDPLEIENCGRKLSFASAPERVVSIGQGSTEILLSLGLGNRVVGTAIWLAPLPDQLSEEGDALPRLADNSPSFEAVLGTRPDFVTSQWINDIGPGESRVGSFTQFGDFDIPVYVSPAECAKSEFSVGSGDGARSRAWTADLLHREIREFAAIFNVRPAREVLIAENRARIAKAAADVEALRGNDISVLYWFSSPELDGEAYVAGRFGAPAWISDVIGIRNVITSDQEWPLVGWETIAGLDPTVIVLGSMDRRNLPGDDVAAKREFLLNDPVTSQMTAIRAGNLIEMDAQSMNPTLRAVDGVEILARGLRELGLTE